MKTNTCFAALLAAAGTLVAGWSLGQTFPWGGAELPSGASDPIRCPARELLPRSSARLAEACAHMERDRGNRKAALRVAAIEISHARQLALAAYEEFRARQATELADDQAAYQAWWTTFMRQDPEGCLSRAAVAVMWALRCDLTHDQKRDALLLLVTVQRHLGDRMGEIAALEDAVRHEPGDPSIWFRLAEARAHAGRWVQAARAMNRAETIAERGDPRHGEEASTGLISQAPKRQSREGGA
jgi:tetratricopeptide (TPR) repeat protein